MQRPRSLSPMRVRVPLGLANHSVSIADLALEVCEEKLAETRRRKPIHSKLQLPDRKLENPFLSRLGSPFVASRSIQAKNLLNSNNVHPLKAPRKAKKVLPKVSSDANQGDESHSGWAKAIRRLSFLDAPTYTLFLLFLGLIMLPRVLSILHDRLFTWHDLSSRKLNGRHCVLNLYIDKHKKDEFNPDHKASDPFLMDTYRTKGQIKVITRLIDCVSDSFRTNLNVVQHVVFAGSRDGGHLAQEALLHWPPRGKHRTNLHIIADGDSVDSLAYQNIATLENRFTGYNEHVHLYDSKGNIAGTLETAPQDDDEVSESEQRIPDTNLENGDFEAMLWDDDETEAETIVPYFHVDGTSMSSQIDTLEKARSLFESNRIAVVGIEHSRDMDITRLVEFITSLNYKTFMLGLRQLSRIDNLCPETLENILDHPSLVNNESWLYGEKQPVTPPFFVAMPKGRHQLEEMTIQHMYDLFSGAGGGGQVKTANDRKAPTAKK